MFKKIKGGNINEILSGICGEVSSNPNGLSTQEAEARLQKYGKNKLAEGKKVTLMQRFLEQLSDPMLIILMVAAVVSGITNYLSGESPVDVFIIMFVVILNSVLGVIQESKAEKAIEALKRAKTSFPATLSRWKQATPFLPIPVLLNAPA